MGRQCHSRSHLPAVFSSPRSPLYHCCSVDLHACGWCRTRWPVAPPTHLIVLAFNLFRLSHLPRVLAADMQDYRMERPFCIRTFKRGERALCMCRWRPMPHARLPLPSTVDPAIHALAGFAGTTPSCGSFCLRMRNRLGVLRSRDGQSPHARHSMERGGVR